MKKICMALIIYFLPTTIMAAQNPDNENGAQVNDEDVVLVAMPSNGVLREKNGVLREKIRIMRAIEFFQTQEMEVELERNVASHILPRPNDQGFMPAGSDVLTRNAFEAEGKLIRASTKTEAAKQRLFKFLRSNNINFAEKVLGSNEGNLITRIAKGDYERLPLFEKVRYQIQNEHPYLSSAVVTTTVLWALYIYKCYQQTMENCDGDEDENKSTFLRIFFQMKAQRGKVIAGVLVSACLIILGLTADEIRIRNCYDKAHFDGVILASTQGISLPPRGPNV